MGRRATTRPMDLSDHTAMVNRRVALHHDLWDWGCNPPRGKLPNAENKLFHPKRQWWATGGEPRLNQGKKRKNNDPISLLPLEAQEGVWCQREVEAIGTRGFSIKESHGSYQGTILGNARTLLGRTIPDYLSSRNRCILFRRFRRKSCTLFMECKYLENVLLLTKEFL